MMSNRKPSSIEQVEKLLLESYANREDLIKRGIWDKEWFRDTRLFIERSDKRWEEWLKND